MEQPPQQPPAPASPPAQPAWGQPPAAPASQWVQPPTVAAARGSVTGLAKIGAVILILFGLLWTLFWGAVVVLGAALKGTFDQFGTGVGDTLGGAVAIIGVFFLIIAVLELVVGIASWMGKEWARIGGIIYGLVFGGICLVGALGTASGGSSSGTNTTSGLIVLGVLAIAYFYTLVVFAVRWRSRV